MQHVLTRLTFVALAAVAVGCDDSQPFPAGPSSTAVAVSTNPSAGSTNQAVARPVAVRGTVSNLTGTCPTLMFSVGSTTITTSAMTVFQNAACADLANGSRVALDADESDGSAVARRIEIFAAAPPPSTRVHGTVASLSGSCPELTFMVGTVSVSTTSSTVFGDGGCQALAAGATVLVDGTSQSDGFIVAGRVFTVHAPRPTP